MDDREDPAPGARDRAQQDARRPALQRVPGVLPGERGRVLRLLLRLLPARGLHPAGRSLHREGLVAERRHRPAAAVGHVLAHDPARRRRRRVGLVHLRARLSRGVARARADPGGGGGAGPRRRPPEADREPVRPQRHDPRARSLPREGRRHGGAAREPGDGVPRLLLRRRGRADHALRPAHGRGLREARQPRDLARDRVRHLAARRSSGRSTRSGRSSRSRSRSSRPRTGCSRRTGSASGPSTTWRC